MGSDYDYQRENGMLDEDGIPHCCKRSYNEDDFDYDEDDNDIYGDGYTGRSSSDITRIGEMRYYANGCSTIKIRGIGLEMATEEEHANQKWRRHKNQPLLHHLDVWVHEANTDIVFVATVSAFGKAFVKSFNRNSIYGSLVYTTAVKRCLENTIPLSRHPDEYNNRPICQEFLIKYSTIDIDIGLPF